MYTTFAHTADVGLRVEAADRNTLFAEAGQAIFSLIVADLRQVESRIQRRYTIEGTDPEYLLVDWLSELLYTFESERLLLCQFDVSVGDGGLTATARGEPWDPARHRLENEVKAVTYHGLHVVHDGSQWTATVIVDI
jgi:SHS2 domain-containing protein